MAVFVAVDQRQQRLGEARQIPQRDARLVRMSVAAHLVDRAVHRRGIVGVHEGAGAVIDGLAGYRAVVGVHHTMDEADMQPACDKFGLTADHCIEQGANGMFGFGCVGIVPVDHMIGELSDAGDILARGEKTETCRREYGLRRRESARRPAASSHAEPVRP